MAYTDIWGSDEQLVGRLPLLDSLRGFDLGYTQPGDGRAMRPLPYGDQARWHSQMGHAAESPVQQVQSPIEPSGRAGFITGQPDSPKPMFSGPGDMADRRLAVLERTDPEAAAALRQKLGQVQAQHQVEQQYNQLHDQSRTPAHYGRDVETDGGPLSQSEVAGMQNKQNERDYLTLNPGMRRFLGNQPVQDDKPKFPLLDSLTKNVRDDNGTTYGEVAGRDAVKNAQGNWSILPKTRYSRNDEENAEWQRTHSAEYKQMLADNAKSYPAKVAARAQAKQQAHMQHIAGRSAPSPQQAAAPFNPYAITAEQADRLMAMYGPDKATPIINNAAQRALAWDQQQAQMHSEQSKMANDRSIAEMNLQQRAKEEEAKLAAQRDAMKNEHSMAEMRERTQRQIHDPAMKAAETRMAIAVQSGDPIQMAQAQRDYSAAANSNRGGVPSPPTPEPEVPLPTPSSDQIKKALNDVTNNFPNAQSDPAQAAQAQQFLKQQGVRPTDLQDYRNSDNGDPSWYEWWDKYVAPTLSTEAGNEIARRRRNVPLLDSLLTGTRL